MHYNIISSKIQIKYSSLTIDEWKAHNFLKSESITSDTRNATVSAEVSQSNIFDAVEKPEVCTLFDYDEMIVYSGESSPHNLKVFYPSLHLMQRFSLEHELR